MVFKIVWGTDGSPTAGRAFALARDAAAESSGEIVAVHVMKLQAVALAPSWQAESHA